MTQGAGGDYCSNSELKGFSCAGMVLNCHLPRKESSRHLKMTHYQLRDRVFCVSENRLMLIKTIDLSSGIV